MRPLAYPDSDAVLICFDISRPETLDSVLKKVSAQPWPVPGVLCGPHGLPVPQGSKLRPWLESVLRGSGALLLCAECKVFPLERSLVNGTAHGSLQQVCGDREKCRAFVLFFINTLEGVMDLC